MNIRFDDDETFRFKKKFNKNKFCKKNRLGGGYGPHLYNDGQKYCYKCGHINKVINDSALNDKGE